MNAKKIIALIIAETNPLKEFNVLNYLNLTKEDYKIAAISTVALFQRRKEHFEQMKPEELTALIRGLLNHENNKK